MATERVDTVQLFWLHRLTADQGVSHFSSLPFLFHFFLVGRTSYIAAIPTYMYLCLTTNNLSCVSMIKTNGFFCCFFFTFWQIFSKVGRVLKIVTFTKNSKFYPYPYVITDWQEDWEDLGEDWSLNPSKLKNQSAAKRHEERKEAKEKDQQNLLSPIHLLSTPNCDNSEKRGLPVDCFEWWSRMLSSFLLVCLVAALPVQLWLGQMCLEELGRRRLQARATSTLVDRCAMSLLYAETE